MSTTTEKETSESTTGTASPSSSSESPSSSTATSSTQMPPTKKRKHENTLSSSSSSSSDEEDENSATTTSKGWRVKLYRLNTDGTWDDCGTGRIVCQYNHDQSAQKSTASSPDQELYRELGEPTLCMQAEVGKRILLRTKILLRDAYQRQGDNIITWCEPYYGDDNQKEDQQQTGVDLALSFQDNAGCLDIWRQITQVQSRAADWFRSHENNSVTDMAHAVAAAHHANLQRQQQHAMWVNVASEAHLSQQQPNNQKDEALVESNAEAVAVSMAAAAAAAYSNDSQQSESQPSLPTPPTLANLEEIADIIAAAQQPQQRDSLALFMSRNDCSYLKALLSLFPSAEARGDYGSLATLAACIKTILLMNDPSTIELIVQETPIYEQVCSALEYDPDLRDKANHRWFLSEKAKFRTVVLMEDQELIDTIHRSFRVTYLRDTLLRPTMDEGSLSTLSSLQTFTHADVVKGVTQGGDDSYLVKVIRLLGKELPAIAQVEWSSLEREHVGGDSTDEKQPPVSSSSTLEESNSETSSLSTVVPSKDAESLSWKQYLAPQDASLESRKIRRKGALSFFRELFNMVRMSLQPSDKDDFYAAIVNMEVDLENNGSVNLLSLLGSVLSDPSVDALQKGGVLEIISAIAMHDPSLIRRHCLDLHEVRKKETSEKMACPSRPNPNNAKQVIFCCDSADLLASLLFLMAVETDAGLLLQTTEIMRFILDTDMLGEHGPMEGGPPGMQHPAMEHSTAPHAGPMDSDQNHFLAMFYEHYVEWLVAPFQYSILQSVKRVPDKALASPDDSPLMKRIMETFRIGVAPKDPLMRIVPHCAIRSAFAVELMSFCVRVHSHRMKFFLLRSRVLGSVLRLLRHGREAAVTSGDRCLKLAALRFLRSILSVKDEFYHRHIIQHNLFAPVFEAFRANPVGDNLVSSTIVEMCDFIHNQNIKSLIEYIVTKHLLAPDPSSVTDRPSLEDVATPYVQTLTILRKTYEDDLRHAKAESEASGEQGSGKGTSYGDDSVVRPGMSEKALEDQRKFREIDEEESYFESDDDEGIAGNQMKDPATVESDLHRTPRMFSLSEQVSSLDPPREVEKSSIAPGSEKDNDEKVSLESKTQGDDGEAK